MNSPASIAIRLKADLERLYPGITVRIEEERPWAPPPGSCTGFLGLAEAKELIAEAEAAWAGWGAIVEISALPSPEIAAWGRELGTNQGSAVSAFWRAELTGHGDEVQIRFFPRPGTLVAPRALFVFTVGAPLYEEALWVVAPDGTTVWAGEQNARSGANPKDW